MRKFLFGGVMLITSMVTMATLGNSEVSLFNSHRKPVAYVANDLTIYFWSGRPVAYLHAKGDILHVYGFNGKHLGWLHGGIMYNSHGNAYCAFRDAFSGYTEFESFKSFKQFKPFKSFREFAPFRPFFSNTWSDIPCQLHLGQGNPS